MQVVGLARLLKRTCSRLHCPAACSYLRFSRQNLASEAAVRTYYAGQLCYAARDGRIDSLKSGSDVEHPLAIGKLRNLAPDVPHMFFSRSTSPYFNLAVEHHLLTYSHPSSRILFTYTNTPCVVIGRNQNPWVECDIRTITKRTSDGRHVQLIRRRSGGGTVFHDEGNLNYTVIVPGDGFERMTHVQMVVDALATLREKQNVSRRWNKVRVTDRNDIVACLKPKHREDGGEEKWFKVSGTAFKLTRGRALHHGTLLHSSPYIDSIGMFLRSPGKDYITAKGVESVRSPVTNLWNVEKHRRRQDMSTSIRKAIERMWALKYAVESVVPPDAIQVAEGQPEDLIPELMSGLQELRTDSWRWDQTPGFSFDSKEIVMAGQRLRLTFEVKNGLVQSVQISEVLQAKYEQLLLGQKIRDLSAPGRWEGLLIDGEMGIDLQRRLIKILQLCFPPLESKDNLEKGMEKQKKSDITLETFAEPNFDARGNLKRDTGEDQPAARAGLVAE